MYAGESTTSSGSRRSVCDSADTAGGAPDRRRLTLLTSGLPINAAMRERRRSVHENEELSASAAGAAAQSKEREREEQVIKSLEAMSIARPAWRKVWRRPSVFGTGDDGGFAERFDELIKTDEVEWKAAKLVEATRSTSARVADRRNRLLQKLRRRQRRAFTAALAREEPFAQWRLRQYEAALHKDVVKRSLRQGHLGPRVQSEVSVGCTVSRPTSAGNFAPSATSVPTASVASSDDGLRLARYRKQMDRREPATFSTAHVGVVMSAEAPVCPGGIAPEPDRPRVRLPAPPDRALAARQRGLAKEHTPVPPPRRSGRRAAPVAEAEDCGRHSPHPPQQLDPRYRRALLAATGELGSMGPRWGGCEMLRGLKPEHQANVWSVRAKKEGADFSQYKTLRGAPLGSSKWSHYLFHLDWEGSDYVARELRTFSNRQQAGSPDSDSTEALAAAAPRWTATRATSANAAEVQHPPANNTSSDDSDGNECAASASTDPSLPPRPTPECEDVGDEGGCELEGEPEREEAAAADDGETPDPLQTPQVTVGQDDISGGRKAEESEHHREESDIGHEEDDEEGDDEAEDGSVGTSARRE